ERLQRLCALPRVSGGGDQGLLQRKSGIWHSEI
ncbi:MAG: hypothetical protein RL385_3092, partial [Pseudomonadota bacterium]